MVYAFGQRWGPEDGTRDKIFGFLPGNGIHDIHMNQGNSGRFVGDDGVWQDGGLLVHFPSVDRWTAIFLKFQSQSWHTDDVTGHTIATPAPVPVPDVPPWAGTSPVTPGEPDLRDSHRRGARQPARRRSGRRDRDAAERHRRRHSPRRLGDRQPEQGEGTA